MKFEWDEKKNQLNIKKHKVSFEEAETVFDDPDAVYISDDPHSVYEERFIVIGITERFDDIDRILTVCYCNRDNNDEVIRIISARRATKQESKIYEERYSES